MWWKWQSEWVSVDVLLLATAPWHRVDLYNVVYVPLPRAVPFFSSASEGQQPGNLELSSPRERISAVFLAESCRSRVRVYHAVVPFKFVQPTAPTSYSHAMMDCFMHGSEDSSI